MGTWSYAFNSLGEPVSQVDAWGRQTTFAPFDKLGRPTTRTEPEGATTFTFATMADSATQKVIGALKSIADPGYSESYAYDALGRLKTTTINADISYRVDFAYQATTLA